MKYETIPIPIQASNFNKLKLEIKKAKHSGITPVIISNNDETTRKLFEKEQGIVIAVELKNRKDKLYQRDSGFDKVMANFGKKNNNTLGILINELANSEKREKAKILARIRQNIKIAKKAKINIKFLSQDQDPENLNSLAIVLHSSTEMAKKAISF